jgi:hypothetical protein
MVEWVFGFFFFFLGLLNAWSEFCRYIKSYMLTKYMGHHLTLSFMIFSWISWGLRSHFQDHACVGRGVTEWQLDINDEEFYLSVKHHMINWKERLVVRVAARIDKLMQIAFFFFFSSYQINVFQFFLTRQFGKKQQKSAKIVFLLSFMISN